jgi:molecular chaperone DnaK
MAGAKRSGKFLIYDLGGGTFDVALIEANQGEVQVLAQQGINMLGGRDFDRMIVSEIVRPWLLANFDLPENFLRDPHYRRLARIATLAAEKAKIDLSSLEEASIFASDDEIRLMDQNETEIFLDAPITRSQFEELIRRPVEQTIDLIRNLLEEHNVPPVSVDRIVFVGGPSRIPLVRRLVTETLGIAADLKTDPMTAVAEGAAYYCESRLWGKTAVAVIEEKKDVPFADDPSVPPSAAPVAESEAKPTEGHAAMEGEPDLFFDFDLRTPDEKTTIFVHLEGPAGGRTIRLTGEGFDSGILSLAAGLEISVPLPAVGENKFDVNVSSASGEAIEQHAQTLSITRLVAAPKAVPATQSIAVKILKSADAAENSFVYLVKKGDSLPASGELHLRSAANLKAGSPGSLNFELFQVEYSDRVELNLCVGLFRLDGTDLPKGQAIRMSDQITFVWRMNESGILQASVKLPSLGLDLQAPRFYAPQAGQLSYEGETGKAFAAAVLQRAQEEWGDLAAAVGPDAGPEIGLLKTRLTEQTEILEEAPDDAENLRRVSEEARFIRQDTVRLSRKYTPALLQRELGQMQAVFNRIARAIANEAESKAFDDLATKVQQIIDSLVPSAYPAATLCLGEMKRVFFAAAWRNGDYIRAWFEKLSQQPWLFADQSAFKKMVSDGTTIMATGHTEAMRDHVLRMLEARIALSASDEVNELATIIKG